MSSVDPNPLVPVTVVGGYLGAGKTTLINRLLAGDHGRRLAVLVNDFGDVNIDRDLIDYHDGATVGLTNGCVCCSIADALGDGLDQVLALDPQPEQIVVEASGVADPAKIAAYGRGWPGCRLDSVLVVADAETIRARSTDRFVGELVVRQLAAADVIVVTKCDLVDPSQVAAVARWASSVAGCPIVPVHRGAVDAELFLDPRSPRPAPAPEPKPGGDRPGRRSNPEPEAGRLFESATLRIGEPLRRKALERALATWPDSIVRVKGFACLEERDQAGSTVTMVNRVGRRWSIEQQPLPDRRSEPITILTIIAIAGTLTGPLHPADLTEDLTGDQRRP